LGAALRYSGAVDALRQACSDGTNTRVVPRQPSQIAQALFPSLPSGDAIAAAGGLAAGISAARTTPDDPLLPLRAHIMFRNVQGLWACTDAACTATSARAAPCPVGALHYIPS